jgi:long-chain acyl-CoA synthetase
MTEQERLHVYVHAERTPNKLALRMAQGGAVSFAELEEGSNRLAQMLRGIGLHAGDHIALLLENQPRFLEVCLAAQRSGLYYTAVSTRLTANEAAYIIIDCGAKAFITSRAMAVVAAELRELLPAEVVRLMLDGTIDGYASLEDTAAGYPATRISDEVTGADMLYSSGTTGRPKGVLRPPESSEIDNPTTAMPRLLRLFGFNQDTVYLSPAPLYHAAPLRFCMGTQQLGGTVVVMEHFDAEEFLHLVQTHRITHTQLVPTMFVRMLKLPAEVRARYDVSSLRSAIHAAAPCPVPIKEQMIEWWGPIIWEYYAATEGNGLTLVNSVDWLAHRGTVGRAVIGRAHVCGPSGDELPVGQTGLVYFSDGPGFAYYNDPGKTAAARNASGWSTLGDVGYMDASGYLYLTDRTAFTIITGGVNVYPQECENLLVTHPKVVDAAVFGVPNDEFGEEVKAVVQPNDMRDSGAQLESELIAFCRQHLSPIKCPRSIDFELELPRSPTGKLYKQTLRERYWR